MSDTSAVVSELKKWGSCDVADGLVKLNHAHGGFLEDIILRSPQFQSGDTKIVGPAYTVKMVPKSDTTSPILPGHYIDSIPKDAVVFISQPLPHISAVFGGLMALRAMHLEAAGTVIDGNLRDLEEHRGLGYPICSKGVSSVAGGEARASEINVPIKLNSTVQERWINPGDYIVADLNGVVCIPQDLAKQVLEELPGIAENSSKCAEGIKEGRPVAAIFKELRGQ